MATSGDSKLLIGFTGEGKSSNINFCYELYTLSNLIFIAKSPFSIHSSIQLVVSISNFALRIMNSELLNNTKKSL